MSQTDPPGDPFAAFESDRTVIKPSAGRGARTPAPAAPVTAELPLPELALPAATGAVGPNPLVQAAAPLLALGPRVRASARHPNPPGLRAQLVDAVARFESAARAQALPNEQVVAARYVLCTYLDECAASTPWGGSGAWASQSLLVQFHGEAWGGEKVFQLLARLAQDPATQRSLLELIYLVLALGFEGRYRVLDGGRQQLDAIRARLAQTLRGLKPAPERALSAQWRGVEAAPTRLADGVPVWAVAAVTALVLLVVYVWLRLAVNAETDSTFAALQGIDAQAAPPPPAPIAPAAPPPPPRLAQLLRSDIDAGKLQVADMPDKSVVTLRGDGLFAAGSADVDAAALPLFDHIAAALAQLPGAVVVSGHTDNAPIRSLRFPSNWHLSKARAESARALLVGRVAPARVAAEGLADTEPLADNGTPEGRARNRRVEITLAAATN